MTADLSLAEQTPALDQAPAAPDTVSVDFTAWPKERRLLWKRTREDGIPLDTIAKAVGFSRSLLSQFIHKDDAKPSQKFLASLQTYFKSIHYWQEADLFGLSQGGYIKSVDDLEMIYTDTLRRIRYVLETTAHGKNFGMITGPSGCGKTAAVHFWLDLDDNREKSVFLTANGCMTRKAILRRIAKELGMFAPADADALIERICAELKSNPKLIIIDEADQICTEYKLETLRSLIDSAAGTAGIVLIGNEDLSERILRMAIDKRKLARIHNRFGANQRVRMPSDEEAAKWLERVNLTDGARRKFIMILQRANGMGGYRVCRTILSTVFAAVEDRVITEELLRSEGLHNAVLSLNA